MTIMQLPEAIDMQQPAFAAAGGWGLGDEFLGQLIVELGELEVRIHWQACIPALRDGER